MDVFLESVTFAYGGGVKQAFGIRFSANCPSGDLQILLQVDTATLQLRSGECVALIGPNEAGKTTFARLIVGELKPDTGAIVYRPRAAAATDAAPFSARGYVVATVCATRPRG